VRALEARAVELADCKPAWLVQGGARVGVSFECPRCKDCGPTHRYEVQFDLGGLQADVKVSEVVVGLSLGPLLAPGCDVWVVAGEVRWEDLPALLDDPGAPHA
jgi:hypothetical protein